MSWMIPTRKMMSLTDYTKLGSLGFHILFADRKSCKKRFTSGKVLKNCRSLRCPCHSTVVACRLFFLCPIQAEELVVAETVACGYG